MSTVFLIGKGKLFESVKKSIHESHTDTHDLQIVDYELGISKNLFLDRPLDQVGPNHFVYLFPHSLFDGIKLLGMFSTSGSSHIFIVTSCYGSSNVYKRMGANCVICSSPDTSSFNWLLTS